MIAPCRFQGVVYPSISEAARQTGFHRRTISSAIEAGTDEQVGGRPKLRQERTCGVPVLWQGKIYPSIAKAARETRRSEDAVLKGCTRLSRRTFGGPEDKIKLSTIVPNPVTSTPLPSDEPAVVSAASAAGS